MTDEAANGVEPTEAEAPSVKDYLEELMTAELPDHWLGLWVEILNKSAEGTGIAITLMVDGILVSGQLVGGRTYFKGMADQLRANAVGPQEGIEAMAEVFEKETRLYPEDDPDSDAEPTERPRQTAYIHLGNARVFSAAGTGTRGTPVWWRGRLASVDGFWFGSASVEE